MLRVILLAVAATCALGAQSVETIAFRAILSSDNEVPAANIAASGTATVWLHVVRDQQGRVTSASTDFLVSYAFPAPVSITGMHIHRGRAGENGPVTINSGIRGASPVVSETGSGTLTYQGFTSSTDTAGLETVNGMLSEPSGFYVNVHTTDFPGGAIRGQLERAEMYVRMALMSGKNEVPANDLTALGTGTVIALLTRNTRGDVTSGQVIFDANYRGFAENTILTGFHIHAGPAGANAPVTVSAGVRGGTDAPVTATGAGNLRYVVDVLPNDTTGRATLMGIVNTPERYYLNLHTTEFPGGAIRGQLRRTDALRFPVTLSAGNEVPALTLAATAAGALNVYTLRDSKGDVTAGAVIFDYNYRFPGAAQFTGMHVHNGAAGENGPVTIDSGLSRADVVVSDSGAGNLFAFTTVSDGTGLATLNSLVGSPERHYVNLHTMSNPSGAVRAQLAGPPARPSVFGVLSSVSDPSMRTVSPGGLMTVFGENLTRAWARIGDSLDGLQVPTRFNGTEVQIGGIAAPILEFTPTHAVLQVPVELKAGTHPLSVRTGAGDSNTVQVPVAQYAPAIFFDEVSGIFGDLFYQLTGRPDRPAIKGRPIWLFGTGMGPTREPAVTGRMLRYADPLRDSVTVLVDGREVRGTPHVASAYLGLHQVLITLPADIRSGAVPVQVHSGDAVSNSVTLYVQ